MQLLLTGQGHYKSVKRDLGQAEIVREKLHLAQLEHAFRSYKDDVPTTFNRHGSSHGVGLGRQFSHLNAVLGAAHLVSAMRQHERASSTRTADRPEPRSCRVQRPVGNSSGACRSSRYWSTSVSMIGTPSRCGMERSVYQ